MQRQVRLQQSHHARHDLCRVSGGERRFLPGNGKFLFNPWALTSFSESMRRALPLPQRGTGFHVPGTPGQLWDSCGK